MAEVVLEGFDDLQAAFKAIESIPFTITRKALNAMAEEAENAIRNTGNSMGVRDKNSRTDDVHILDCISHSKPMETDGGGKSFITFTGSRKRGNTVTRNAEIAYINEFGAPVRGITARPFILTAMTKNDAEISAPADEIIGNWITQTYAK